MKKTFKFLSVFLIFFYITLVPQQAKAEAFALPALSTGFMSGVGEGAGAIAEISAPYVLPVIAGCVAAGVVYKNRNQIATFAKGALNYLETVGDGIGKGIINIGDGASVMTSDAKAKLMDYIQSVKSSPTTFTIPLVNTVSIPSNTTVWLSLYLPINTSTDAQISMLKTGSLPISNLYFSYRVDDYPQYWTGSQNGYIYWGHSGLVADGNTINLPSYKNLQIGINNIGGFPVDVGIVQKLLPDGSICANVGTNYADDVFSKPDSAVKVSPASTALTWDDVIGLDNTNLKTKVKVNDTSVPTDTPTDTPVNPAKPIDTSMPDTSKSLDFTPLKTINLTKKFPFCIPFDIASSFKSLSASPKAPKWTINFDSKYFAGGGSVDIDFSIFEQWAIVVRWGILIVFSISLMLITKRMIGGSN